MGGNGVCNIWYVNFGSLVNYNSSYFCIYIYILILPVTVGSYYVINYLTLLHKGMDML